MLYELSMVFTSDGAPLAWIDKGAQTDFYDVPEYVNIAADRAAAWFEETL